MPKRTPDDRVKVLHGPYRAPRLRVGDHAVCLLRDGDVVVTSWTDAPIPWPRCHAFGTRGGGSGLLLAGDLVKAVRQESAAAVMYWWGVCSSAVWRWRKALGVTCTDNPGSARLIRAAALKGGAKLRQMAGRPDGGKRIAGPEVMSGSGGRPLHQRSPAMASISKNPSGNACESS
jgi:hypothetical protein